eukprot:CAMPEP_0196142660 /NCGR_PEP_ID=MMETSP0910-20130528/12028_1 /TAXON_ID=49265 /ORGANISM="Thalassiosira rotula, Strain GSO102" /LENGTH=552 /DNA_ID=CAMNT_0041404001 /DNA_START=79 /DNA_END=1740 /DNA_ORIENTATION=-
MAPPPRFPTCVSVSSSGSSDDGSSSDGSAPASPRSTQPPPPPAYHAPVKNKNTTLPSLSLSASKSTKTDMAEEPLDRSSLHSLASAASTSTHSRCSPTATLSSIARSSVSLESLLNEKTIMLASFEDKFNEKILSHQKELMDEQRRSLESKASEDKNGSLAKEVKRLQDKLEEQKFSHQVEMTLQMNKAEKLEEMLKENHVAHSSSQSDGRIKKLEEELTREKDLRINQLRSLEQLHFAEFRQLEKKHAEIVCHLVASYRKEVKVLKSQMTKAGENNIAKSDNKSIGKTISPALQESSDTAAAAAALSALASPVTGHFISPNASTENDIDGFAIAMAARLPVVTSAPCASPEKGESKIISDTGKRGKKRNIMVSMAKGSSVPKLNPSEVSDSSSAGGDTDQSEQAQQKPSKKVKQREQVEEIIRKTVTQRGQVEEFLKKAGKAPPTKQKNNTKERKMLSEQTKDYLKNWMMSPEHCDHPYPTPEEKAVIMVDTGINFTELNNWFVNNRKRFWQNVVKPKIPEIKKAHRMKKMEESYDSCSAETIHPENIQPL